MTERQFLDLLIDSMHKGDVVDIGPTFAHVHPARGPNHRVNLANMKCDCAGFRIYGFCRAVARVTFELANRATEDQRA